MGRINIATDDAEADNDGAWPFVFPPPFGGEGKGAPGTTSGSDSHCAHHVLRMCAHRVVDTARLQEGASLEGWRRTISSVLRGAISSLVVHSDGFWQDSDGTQPKGTIRKKIESSKHRNALLLS